MRKTTIFLKINKISQNPIYRALIAAMSLIVFYIILALIGYIILSRGIDFWLIKQYVVISLIGTLPVVFRQYFFSIIFLVGAAIGWAVACYTAFLQGPHPTMAGVFYNIFIVFFSFLMGLIVQIRYNIRKANPDLSNKTKLF